MEEIVVDDLPISRTKKKQQAKQIEQMAEQLVGLTDKQYKQIELSVEVADEADMARVTKGRSSFKRQLKHLAGMIRKSDGAFESLERQLASLDQVSRGDKKQFHKLEKLRDRLCSADSYAAAFEEMMELAPGIDRKVVSRLANSYQQHEDKRAYREIFRRLRDELEG